MKTLNFNSKQAQNFVKAYFTENKRFGNLNEVYKTYSNAKFIAYKECLKKFYTEYGSIAGSVRIISANTFHFTMAWRNIKGLRIETKQNSYLVELPF